MLIVPITQQGTVQIPKSVKEVVESKECNKCPFCECTDMGQYSIYSVFKCRYLFKAVRVLKSYANKNDVVVTPADCPLRSNPNVPKMTVGQTAMSAEQLKAWNEATARKERREKWDKIKGITKWEDIKVGMDYHIPPTMDKPRMDVHVSSKYNTYLMCKVIGKENESVFLYNNGHEYKFMKLIEKKAN